MALAWDPYDRGDWLLENLLSVPLAVGLLLGRRRLPFSTASWCLVFSFLALHEIGSHYTYSRVPWMEWSRDLLGWAPAWERNHYDRFIHLCFGLLLTRPMAELLAGRLAGRPALRRVMPVCCIMTLSSVYELLEWAAALIVDPGLGIAFVGAQGDPWDAQKDMALALGGSCLATVLGWVWEAARPTPPAGPSRFSAATMEGPRAARAESPDAPPPRARAPVRRRCNRAALPRPTR